MASLSTPDCGESFACLDLFAALTNNEVYPALLVLSLTRKSGIICEVCLSKL